MEIKRNSNVNNLKKVKISPEEIVKRMYGFDNTEERKVIIEHYTKKR